MSVEPPLSSRKLRSLDPYCVVVSFSDLRTKYEEMLALRRADDALDPRPRLAALAARFPGALREIDDLPLDEIERRIQALARAERDPAAASEWMHAMLRFHALARGILFAKRMTPVVAPAGSKGARSPLAEALERDDWPPEARVWRDDLARVARPPRGRLMDLVYERLARELETTPALAKALVFSPSSRA